MSNKLMPKLRQNPHNHIVNGRRLGMLMIVPIFAYVVAFFNEPSLLQLRDESGQLLARWFDLSQILLLEQLLAETAGGGRFSIGILDRLPIAFAGLVWIGLAAVIGHPLVRLSGLSSRLSKFETGGLATLAGLALLSTLTLLVGLAGGLHSVWPLLGGTGALVIGALAVLYGPSSRQRSLIKSERSKAENAAATKSHVADAGREPIAARSLGGQWLQRLLPTAVGGLAALYVLGSLTTPYEFDVVEYHLQAPKEYAAAGSIDFNAHNVYANMPLGAEMHSLAMMIFLRGGGVADWWWWGGLVGKFITGSISLIAAALLAGFVSRYLGRWSGWAAAGLLLSSPGNFHVASAGLIDSVVGAYIAASLIVWTTTWDESRRHYCMLLASVLAGAAAACKYPGLVFAVIPLGVATGIWLWRERIAAVSQAKLWGAALLGLGLTCIPWLAKNAVQVGNPVFPLAANIFGGGEWTAAQVAQWQQAHRIPVVDGSSHGLAAVLSSIDQLLLASPFLSPTLIALLVCGIVAAAIGVLYASRVSPAAVQAAAVQGRGVQAVWITSWLAMTIWILAVWWFATHRIDRFWLPVLPLYATIAAFGVAWIGRELSVSLASGLVLLSVIYGAFIGASGAVGENRFFVQLKELRVDAGSELSDGRIKPFTLWINQNVEPVDSKVLLVGEARAFDFEPPIEYSTCFDVNPAERYLRGKTAAEQRRNLADAGAKYLLIHWDEIARYRSPGNYGFSDWPQRRDIAELVQRGVVERVPWPFDIQRVELLKVEP